MKICACGRPIRPCRPYLCDYAACTGFAHLDGIHLCDGGPPGSVARPRPATGGEPCQP